MKKRLLGILLSFALMLTMMPVLGLSLTAFAGVAPPYAQYKNTTKVIKFDNKDWYLIDYDSITVTLLSKECVGASVYNSSGSFVEYSSNPTVKTAVDDWYSSKITADAKAAVSGDGMFLLTMDQANKIKQANLEVLKCDMAIGAEGNAWWLCSKGDSDNQGVIVYGNNGDISTLPWVTAKAGVRPALKLDLSKVAFVDTSTTRAFTPIIDVTGVDLNKTSTTLTVGDSETLTATVTPADATHPDLDWDSSDVGVAKVVNGEVTAIAPGTATITVRSLYYPEKSATCTVTVTEKTTPAPAPATASVTVNSKTVSDSTLAAACAKAGVNPDSVATVVLGKKVKKIKKGSFQNLRNANTLVVKSKKLTKARVKGSLKGSSITKVKVNVGKKKTNKYYAKRYKKIFTKKNCGKKVSVSR